jgi:hypothetical protein
LKPALEIFEIVLRSSAKRGSARPGSLGEFLIFESLFDAEGSVERREGVEAGAT